MVAKSQRTVLITGCSEGGLGAALCRAFREQNFHVFATARDPTKVASLKQDGIEVFTLDVTSSESIEKCAGSVAAKTEGKLDVLVNNAGNLKVIPLLDVSIAEARRLYDVNVFGLLAVTQAFSPLLIRSKGVVLNISSIQGIYASSKAAVASISDILRVELGPFSVRVITGMIGAVDTTIYKNHEAIRASGSPQTHLFTAVGTEIGAAATGTAIPEMEPADKTAADIVKDVTSGQNGYIWRGTHADKVTQCQSRVGKARLHYELSENELCIVPGRYAAGEIYYLFWAHLYQHSE